MRAPTLQSPYKCFVIFYFIIDTVMGLKSYLIVVLILSCLLFYILCCYKVASVMSNSVRPHRWQPTKLLCPWDSPGKNTGVGCHFLLQGIFPTQGLNSGLLHHRQILYCLSHQEALYISQCVYFNPKVLVSAPPS